MKFIKFAPQTGEAVHKVDNTIYQLTESVKSTGLPVNFVLLADHGMTAVDTLHWIPTPAIIDTYQVYLKKEMPAHLHFGAADDRYNRVGDIVLLKYEVGGKK